MLHSSGRSHALTGEAVAPGLSGLLFLRRLPAGGELIARHPRRPTAIQAGFQGPNPPLQLGNHQLLLGNDLQQSFPTRRV